MKKVLGSAATRGIKNTKDKIRKIQNTKYKMKKVLGSAATRGGKVQNKKDKRKKTKEKRKMQWAAKI